MIYKGILFICFLSSLVPIKQNIFSAQNRKTLKNLDCHKCRFLFLDDELSLKPRPRIQLYTIIKWNLHFKAPQTDIGNWWVWNNFKTRDSIKFFSKFRN